MKESQLLVTESDRRIRISVFFLFLLYFYIDANSNNEFEQIKQKREVDRTRKKELHLRRKIDISPKLLDDDILSLQGDDYGNSSL
jgi:hypothetical protein